MPLPPCGHPFLPGGILADGFFHAGMDSRRMLTLLRLSFVRVVCDSDYCRADKERLERLEWEKAERLADQHLTVRYVDTQVQSMLLYQLTY